MNKTEKENIEELSPEQKIWKGMEVFFHSIRPLILYLFVPAITTYIGRFLFGGRPLDEILSESGNFYYTLGIILTFVILHKRSKKRGSSLREDVTFEYRELEWKKIACLMGMGFGFGFFFSALVTVIPFPELLMESYMSSSEAVKDGSDPILALLSTVLLAPVVEEIIFRGYMLNRLLSWFDEKKSILITAMVFALCHVSLIWIVYAFLMGAALAKISIDEDNISYSMALHIGFNANVVPIWVINHIPKLKDMLFSNGWLIALYGALSCFLAVWLLGKYRKETKLW